MFTPIHTLPQLAPALRSKLIDRWETREGKRQHTVITNLIMVGAGEHLLESDFQNGYLNILEDEHDLVGFMMSNLHPDFSRGGDNFKGLDLSYGRIYNSIFERAVFLSCTMQFTRFYNCTFRGCSFAFNSCFGAMFEKVKFVDCDFGEGDSFTNCQFAETEFKNMFLATNVFYDCKLDSLSPILSFSKYPVAMPEMKTVRPDQALADIYIAISQAYESGGARSAARKYLFLHSHSATRYNSATMRDKVAGFLFELFSGYGLRPLRPIAAMSVCFCLAYFIFALRVGWQEALLLTCGALFTFGAKSDLLSSLGLGFQIVYVLTAFAGISLTALFITVIVNVSLRGK